MPLNSKSKWLKVLVLLIVSSAAAVVTIYKHFPDTYQKLMSRGPIRVLVDRDWFYHYGYGDDWVGPDIELVRELAERTGRKLEFVPLESMSDLRPGMKDLETISVLLDVSPGVAKELGFETASGIRQPRLGVLRHAEGTRPDAGTVPVVALIKTSGYADAVRLALAGQFQFREVQNHAEADLVFDHNKKVGNFMVPEVDALVVDEVEARLRMEKHEKAEFTLLTIPSPVVPVSFADNEDGLMDTFEKMVQSLSEKGDVDRFQKLTQPPTPLEVEKAADPQGFTLSAAYPLPYQHTQNNSGLACAHGALWAAHKNMVYRIPLEAGVPKVEAAQSIPLTAKKGQDAVAVVFDGTDGFWVGYGGWVLMQYYAPISAPKLVKTVNLGGYVVQYGLALHQGLFHTVGYTAQWGTFDMKNPGKTWKFKQLDRVLWGLASHKGNLFAAANQGLVILQDDRIRELPLHGSIENMGDFQGVAFSEDSGFLYILTKGKLLRYIPGQMDVKVEVQPGKPFVEVAPPPSPTVPLTSKISEVGSHRFPGAPVAILKMDSYWLGASRTTPWGLMKMTLSEGSFIVEERYLEQRPITGIARVGNMVVVSCDSANGGQDTGPVLLQLDTAKNFQVVKQVSIPSSLTALTTDQSTQPRIWGANRANTADSPDEVAYYAFDQNLKLAGVIKSPQRGCQGLVWHGRHLLSVDIFQDALYIVDAYQGYRITTGIELPIRYPSGLCIADGLLYIGDYQTNRIHFYKVPVN